VKIIVLVDNNTFIDRYFIAEPGVSYYIESEGKKILFDVGYSDVFLVNARKLGINLLDVDMIVLSHGHLDHTWGLSHLIRFFNEAHIEGMNARRPTLIAHPMVFASRSYKSDPKVGSLLKEETLGKFFDLKLNRDPVNLTGELVFLGEIERLNDFEGKQSIGTISIEGVEIPDLIADDSALAYSSTQGLVIVTGCSHSGICNIVEYARTEGEWRKSSSGCHRRLSPS